MIGKTNTISENIFSNKNTTIHVITTSDSNVTFIKNNVAVKTLNSSRGYLEYETNKIHYFYSIQPSNYGEWTIQANVGSKTRSKTIEVTSNGQYTVTLLYEQMLFDGVWQWPTESYDQKGCSLVDNEIKLTQTSSYTSSFVTLGEDIDLSPFSKLKMTYRCTAKSRDNLWFGVSSNTTIGGSYSNWTESGFDAYTNPVLVKDGEYYTAEVNIIGVPSKHIKVGCYATIFINKIWLEV